MRDKPDTLPPESEASLLAKVTETARLLGWRVYHPWRSDHSEKGWPDLVLCKPPRLIIAELKGDDERRSKLTPWQDWWLDDLRQCGVDVRSWRPRDWPEIEATLKGEEP